MSLKLKTAPTETPITLAEAKAHCRVDHSDDDAIILIYIKAAVAHCDGNRGVLGRAIVTQVWEMFDDAFPNDVIKIPLGPLVSVDKIEYRDPVTLAYVEFAAANYEVDNSTLEGTVTAVDAWPEAADAPNAVKVTFTAGHGTASEVPFDIKAAILLLVGHWYENREAVVVGDAANTVPMTFDAIVGSIRKITI